MKRMLQRILYVEDEQDIRQIAQLALEAVGGFTLEICASGPAAIASAPGFGPDLVLLDVMMPGMDGLTTFAELRKIPGMEAVPVIFMTAKVLPQEVARYREMGAADVIAKPFDPMTLSDTVNAIWSKINN